MPARASFNYAVVRVVPRVERGEFVNVGAILFCRTRRFLAARIEPDAGRLVALDPEIDLADVTRQLNAILLICAGGDAAGPIGRLPQAERFGWLTAPRSTVIQTSPVHSGICYDPEAELDRLIQSMVKRLEYKET